jgi:hypothetical protein
VQEALREIERELLLGGHEALELGEAPGGQVLRASSPSRAERPKPWKPSASETITPSPTSSAG